MLSILLRQVSNSYANQPYLSILYQSVFSTMYFGLLRISEVVVGTHPVLAKDVHIGRNKRRFLLVLHTSKTHWKDSKPQLIKISSRGGDSITTNRISMLPCPFQLLRNYLNYWGAYVSESEPFFVFADKSPITTKHVRDCLCQMLQISGFDQHLYCTHSIRIG